MTVALRRPLLVALVVLLALVALAAGTRDRAGGKPGGTAGRPSGTAADEIEIRELAARFENTFDDGRIDDHMALWVEDMTFTGSFGTYRGKPAYRAWLEGFYRDAQRQWRGTRHLVANQEVTVTGSTARSRLDLLVMGRDGGRIGEAPNRPVAIGTTVFTDRLRKVDGRWRFVERRAVLDQRPTG